MMKIHEQTVDCRLNPGQKEHHRDQEQNKQVFKQSVLTRSPHMVEHNSKKEEIVQYNHPHYPVLQQSVHLRHIEFLFAIYSWVEFFTVGEKTPVVRNTVATCSKGNDP